MLYLVGLGLNDEKDISIRGLEIIKAADAVYLENYTSILQCPKGALEQLYGRTVIELDRKAVELQTDKLIQDAENKVVVILIAGDPFSATTHSDLFLRAKERSVEVRVIHNASIMTAIGVCGLQLYRYGQTVSIPLFTDTWRPYSFFERIMENYLNDCHTLCLLDIRVKEQTVENLLKETNIYEPPTFMTISQAIEQIFEAATAWTASAPRDITICVEKLQAIGIARAGSLESCVILSGTLNELRAHGKEFGGPLHSLVICGRKLHHMEEKMFHQFRVQEESVAQVSQTAL